MSETTTEMEYVLLNNLEQKEKEIEELKSEINRKNAVGYRWFKRCLEARTENVKLKRELCLSRAQEWRYYAAFCGMQSHCHNHRGFGKTAEKYTWKECHAWKCVKIYKNIAEKFKEADDV